MNAERTGIIEQEAGGTVEYPFSTGCTVTVVDTDEGFNALEQEWNALISRADVTIFQTFEWVHTWWKHYGNLFRLHCLVFNIGGRVAGIAPLFKQDVKMFGVPIATHLQFMGKGLSDYVDVIAVPGYETPVLNALAEHLRTTAGTWDVFDIQDVNERSPLVKVFPEIAARHGIGSYRYQGNVCPRITLPTKEETLGRKGLTSAYNFKRKIKKLQEKHDTQIELFRHESDDLRKGVEMFSELHGRRWKSLGHPSAFDEEDHRAFHLEVSARFARRGWLRLYFLHVNGVPLSACFDFNFNHTIYMYQSNAHGPAELMKASPGFLIRTIAMEDGIAEGMRTFDYLRGNEPYKYTEGNAVEGKNWLIRFPSPGIIPRLRFTSFLICDLLQKSYLRSRFEYHEFKRFTIAKKPTPLNVAQYIGPKLLLLIRLAINFLKRHATIRGRSSEPSMNNVPRTPESAGRKDPE